MASNLKFKCCIPTCKNTCMRIGPREKRFFLISATRFTRFQRAIQEHFPDVTIKQKDLICVDHFSDRNFYSSFRSRLHKFAKPDFPELQIPKKNQTVKEQQKTKAMPDSNQRELVPLIQSIRNENLHHTDHSYHLGAKLDEVRTENIACQRPDSRVLRAASEKKILPKTYTAAAPLRQVNGTSSPNIVPSTTLGPLKPEINVIQNILASNQNLIPKKKDEVVLIKFVPALLNNSSTQNLTYSNIPQGTIVQNPFAVNVLTPLNQNLNSQQKSDDQNVIKTNMKVPAPSNASAPSSSVTSLLTIDEVLICDSTEKSNLKLTPVPQCKQKLTDEERKAMRIRVLKRQIQRIPNIEMESIDGFNNDKKDLRLNNKEELLQFWDFLCEVMENNVSEIRTMRKKVRRLECTVGKLEYHLKNDLNLKFDDDYISVAVAHENDNPDDLSKVGDDRQNTPHIMPQMENTVETIIID